VPRTGSQRKWKCTSGAKWRKYHRLGCIPANKVCKPDVGHVTEGGWGKPRSLRAAEIRGRSTGFVISSFVYTPLLHAVKVQIYRVRDDDSNCPRRQALETGVRQATWCRPDARTRCDQMTKFKGQNNLACAVTAVSTVQRCRHDAAAGTVPVAALHCVPAERFQVQARLRRGFIGVDNVSKRRNRKCEF